MASVKPTGAAKGRSTQWASQFLAAAELVRRGYTVSLTMGHNTPVADLMVGTNEGIQFWVDVKGLSQKNDWLVKPKRDHQNLYYVLVYLAPLAELKESRKPDRFFILSQLETNLLEEKYRLAHPGTKGTMPGFKFKDAEEHEDRWDKLPVDRPNQR